MSASKQISASARIGGGKGAARAVRREGKVPAVIYGAGKAPTLIALDASRAHRMVYAGHFLTTVFELDLDGEKTRVIPRDYQLDPVRDSVQHVDFLRVSAGAHIRLDIPVHVINADRSPGVKAGGSVNIVTHAVTLSVPADNIPEAITVDVAELDINDSVHVSQITLPAGAKLVQKGDDTLVSILPPQAQEAEPAPAAPVATAAPAAEAKTEGKADAKADTKSDSKSK